MQRKVTKGNVFKDLGFSDEEAVALAMRVDLAVEIEKFIRRKKLTQTKAAAYFDVPQPKISKKSNVIRIIPSFLSGGSSGSQVRPAAYGRRIPSIVRPTGATPPVPPQKWREHARTRLGTQPPHGRAVIRPPGPGAPAKATGW